MKIYEVRERTPRLVADLLDIWEVFVRATHHFLSDAEITQIKEYVPQALQGVVHLIIAEDETDGPTAFIGIENNRLEMLFLSPKVRGKGLGKQLLQYAVQDYGVRELTVNEQNPQAVGFYEHLGFQTYKRTEYDEEGNPYPLVYETGVKQEELFMKISEIMEKMIAFSKGNIHDINHFMCVWTYAKTIGELENLDQETQYILEVAAITHDIACPFCREKYGNTNGKYQEKEGMPIVKEFLADTGMSEAQIERVAYLVGHHHTLKDIEGIDYQILIEADYIVNAYESEYSKENIENFIEKVMKTDSGKRITREVFCL